MKAEHSRFVRLVLASIGLIGVGFVVYGTGYAAIGSGIIVVGAVLGISVVLYYLYV